MKNAITIFDHLHFGTPNEQQKGALLAMSAFVKDDNLNDYLILCGAAGTGKTSIVSALISYMNQLEVRYEIIAPTGRAARIIGRKSKTIGNTIHSIIYKPVVNKQTGEVNFTLKQNLCNDKTVFIVDEASMIPSKPVNDEMSLFKSKNSLLDDLVTFVKNGNDLNKILFLGDRYQLPPIGENDSMALCSSYLDQTFKWKGESYLLTEVKRQEDGSSIMLNGVNTRTAIEQKRDNVKLQGFRFNYSTGAATRFVQDIKSNGYDSVISIGATYKMNSFFNGLVRDRLFGSKPEIVEKGDWMVVTQNWNRNAHSLFNGDHVLIEEIHLDLTEIVAGLHFAPVKLRAKNIEGTDVIIDDLLLLESIQYPNGQLELPKENALRHARFAKNPQFRESGFPHDDKYVGAVRLNYGYSITCNKAQGGEWDKVYMNAFYIPSLRYQYTAVTRAKSQLCLY